jgi:hypothetical protein
MKRDWKYILFLSLIFGVYIYVQLGAKKQHSWFLSLDYLDKEPYGTYVLHKLLPSLFPDGVQVSTKTVYELKDSLTQQENILILAQRFEPGKEDLNAMLKLAEKGSTVFLSAEHFGKKLKDTLHIETSFNFFSYASFNESDSMYLEFTNPALKSDELLYFKSINLQNEFSRYPKDSASAFVRTERDNVLTLRIPWGKGQFFLNTTPALFTNIYALQGNHEFISKSLSPLPPTRLIWMETYQVGHRELSTPLRYILTHDPLAWAYYLTLGSILLFMMFEAKRKQRAIPVIKPLTNTSLEFASTIGNLYFQRGDHKNIIEKRIHFFFDYVRTHFYLHGHEPDFVERLSKKSMKPSDQIRTLMQGISACQKSGKLSVAELTNLNKKLEEFYLPALASAKDKQPAKTSAKAIPTLTR